MLVSRYKSSQKLLRTARVAEVPRDKRTNYCTKTANWVVAINSHRRLQEESSHLIRDRSGINWVFVFDAWFLRNFILTRWRWMISVSFFQEMELQGGRTQ